MNLEIISTALLGEYQQLVSRNLRQAFDDLKDAEISTGTFSFYTSVSSVFSSKIEGEEIELDSYVKHKKFGIEFQPDYTRKIDDLYNTYIFAQQNDISRHNISKAHKTWAKTWLPYIARENFARRTCTWHPMTEGSNTLPLRHLKSKLKWKSSTAISKNYSAPN